jgi:hypothetical protein
VIFAHSTGTIAFLVVDSEGWLRPRNFVIALDCVNSDGDHKKSFSLKLSDAQIKCLPPYKEQFRPQEWKDFEVRYRAAMVAHVYGRKGIEHVTTEPGEDVIALRPETHEIHLVEKRVFSERLSAFPTIHRS